MTGAGKGQVEGFSEVLQLLHEMESKLTSAITAGIASVNLSIAQLSERHNASLLEQERKNSSFADRERVEALSRQVHDARNEVSGLTKRVADLADDDRRLSSRLDTLDGQMDSRSLKLLTGLNGYLVSALLIGLGSFLTYVFTHVH